MGKQAAIWLHSLSAAKFERWLVSILQTTCLKQFYSY